MAAEELKTRGNAAFQAGRFSEALEAYSQAIEALSDQEKNEGTARLLSRLLSNRAAARMKLSVPDYRRALQDCTDALSLDSCFVRALVRRAGCAMSLAEEAGDHTVQGMGLLRDAVRDLSRALDVEPKSKGVVAATKRARARLMKAQQHKADHGSVMSALKESGTPAERREALNKVGALFSRQPRTRGALVAAGLVNELLLEASRVPVPLVRLSDSDPLPANGTSDSASLVALRLLALVLSHPADCTLPDPKLVGDACVDQFQTIAALCAKDAPQETEKLRLQHASAMVRLWARAACHPQLIKLGFRQTMIANLFTVFLSPIGVAEQSDGQPVELHTLQTPGSISIMRSCLAALSQVAGSSGRAQTAVRRQILPHILFSPATKIKSLNKALITCLVSTLVEREQHPPDHGVAGPEDEEAEAAEAAREQEQAKMEPIVEEEGDDEDDEAKEEQDDDADRAPPVSEAAKARNETAAKQKKRESALRRSLTMALIPLLMADDFKPFEAGCRALTLLLHASQDLGAFIVKFGLDEAAAREAKRRQAEEDGQAEESLPDIPQPLPMLLFKVESVKPDERMLAAEVLALASSDSVVRETIVASGQVAVFVHLLTHGTSLSVRSNAALAVAKVVAVGKDEELNRVALDDQVVLKSVMEIIMRQDEQAEDDEGGVNETHVRCAVESLAYLSLHASTKAALAANPEWIDAVLKLSSTEDRAVRYGLAQTLFNVCSSSEDLKRGYNKELEELKRMAGKGLRPGEDVQTNEDLANKAGEPELIQEVQRTCVEKGIVRALDRLFIGAMNLSSELRELEQQRGTDEETIPSGTATNALPPEMAKAIATAMLNLATHPPNRGAIVQQRGLRLLLRLASLRFPADAKMTEALQETAQVALARVAISVNPSLYPDQIVVSLVNPLKQLLTNASHELYQFEACLALTNLAVNPLSLKKMVELKVWRELQANVGSENHQVQRAVVETMTNMLMSEEIIEYLHGDGDAARQDVRVFVLFARSDDERTRVAATGALAMMARFEELAKRIAEFEGWETLQALALMDQSADVQVRVQSALQSLADAGLAKDNAEARVQAALEVMREQERAEREEDGLKIEVVEEEEEEEDEAAAAAPKQDKPKKRKRKKKKKKNGKKS